MRRFVAIGSQKRWLVAEAALWLTIARLALLIMPFRRLGPRLGTVRRPAEGAVLACQGSEPDVAALAALAAEVGWAVTRAARHLPFEAVCLPQAMAAKLMLRRRKVAGALYFGMAKGDDGAIQIHAWLLAGGVEVTGYPVADGFTPIACYV